MNYAKKFKLHVVPPTSSEACLVALALVFVPEHTGTSVSTLLPSLPLSLSLSPSITEPNLPRRRATRPTGQETLKPLQSTKPAKVYPLCGAPHLHILYMHIHAKPNTYNNIIAELSTLAALAVQSFGLIWLWESHTQREKLCS